MKKKNRILIYPLVVMGMFILLTNSCKKKDDNTTPTGQVPVLTTVAISNITQTTATCGGNITSDGGATVTARGVCWSTGQTPTIADTKTTDGTGAGSFTSALTGLTANTTYYVRAYATNNVGTGYGSAMSLTTSLETGQIPVLTTSSVSNILQTTATCGGNITSDGGATVTTRGVCWSTGQTPTITDSKTTDGTGAGSFTSDMTGLTANTTYYVRAYATNSAGTGYGSAMSLTTLQESVNTVTDIDGNVYNTITIGTQVWMAENLKTTKYRDGTTIPNVTDNTAWSNLTTGAYCDNSNLSSNSDTYGKLYNWYAVADVHNICPTGWHMPTDAEWSVLTTYLGGESVAGGKLKETGTTHWESPNTGATNETGFTALPGGYRYDNGSFYNVGNYGLWWSSTESNISNAWFRDAYYLYNNVNRLNISKKDGFSVRCVKD